MHSALRRSDREAILRVLEECPEELLELRATLAREGTMATALFRAPQTVCVIAGEFT